MADEYISRTAAVEKITFLCELREIVCNPDDEFLRGLKNALNAVKSNEVIPSADVQPVKRGRWYDVGYEYIDELGINLIHAYCNRCNRITYNRSDYSHTMDCECCSHCGAIMDNWGMNKI